MTQPLKPSKQLRTALREAWALHDKEDKDKYKKLARAVRKIDKGLGTYLLNSAPLRPDFAPSDNLLLVFGWKNTCQGWNTWADIFKKLWLSPYFDKIIDNQFSYMASTQQKSLPYYREYS